MLKTVRSRGKAPSPAMVVACTALVVALGGSAFAAGVVIRKSSQLGKNVVTAKQIRNNAVTGAKVKDQSLSGKDINLAALGKVGSAASADSAGHAASATHADAAGHADAADVATSLVPHEPWHEVGAPGEPTFEHGWANRPDLDDQTVGFFKDREGIVHLKGSAEGPAPFQTIFTLPTGYRPMGGKGWEVAAPCVCQVQDNGSDWVHMPVGQLAILAGGQVVLGTDDVGLASTAVHLDGITFPTY